MRRFTVHYKILLALTVTLIFVACRDSSRSSINNQASQPIATPQPTPLIIPVSDGFDYPVGRKGYATEAKDGDGWYVAQDFGENNHLGEDWNAESGGDTDCGLPVYTASKGMLVFADEAGVGWGKVIIIRHRLLDGTIVETLYGHLQSFAKTLGEVGRREIIGNIGNANGDYPCHLHFELRFSDCAAWGLPGPGYSNNRAGWADPSDFIDAHRPAAVNSSSKVRRKKNQ
ncbi:MAG: peptidase M23 [Acidobacteria bacterium]|nr:MAG: peptidase M23 [Acidobacteriota bacterium]